MSGFLTPLRLEKCDNDDDGEWMLIDTLIYQSDLASRTFLVPKGFKTNFASVPRLPVVFLLTGATCDEAAVVHDYLYSSHEVSRAVADRILSEASAVMGVPAWRRFMMWAGVRVGGASAWNGDEAPTDTTKTDPTYFG